MGSPWTAIWVRPKETIAHIVAQNPNRHLWILAFFYGFQTLLNSFQSLLLGETMGLIPLFLLAIILAPFLGYLAFSVWSWVVMMVGRLFRGQGTFREVRAAYAWSCVPMAINIPLWLILAALLGRDLFTGNTLTDPFSTPLVALLYLITFIRLVIAVWSIVIYLNALAQVQSFSVLRAIGNTLVAALLLGAVYFGCIWVLASLGGAFSTSQP